MPFLQLENLKLSDFLNLNVAELDVLISLAIASDYYEGPTCRPVFTGSSSSDEIPYIYAKSLGHPVLRSDSLGKGSFVPNDITIGGSGNSSFLLLTGPNMGGKSTLLRQVCLAVILAQVKYQFMLHYRFCQLFLVLFPSHFGSYPGRSRCPSWKFWAVSCWPNLCAHGCQRPYHGGPEYIFNRAFWDSINAGKVSLRCLHVTSGKYYMSGC